MLRYDDQFIKEREVGHNVAHPRYNPDCHVDIPAVLNVAFSFQISSFEFHVRNINYSILVSLLISEIFF